VCIFKQLCEEASDQCLVCLPAMHTGWGNEDNSGGQVTSASSAFLPRNGWEHWGYSGGQVIAAAATVLPCRGRDGHLAQRVTRWSFQLWDDVSSCETS